MIHLLVAGMLSITAFAHTPASLPSTKIVAETVAENDAILKAIDQDQEATVKEWLKKGHSSFAAIGNKIKESLLDRAASSGSEKVFEVLIADREAHGSGEGKLWNDGRGTPLLIGLVSLAMPTKPNVGKYERTIERFLKSHSDQINWRDKAYIGDGRTALHQAATNGNTRVVDILLSHGAQLDSVNSTGETPLHFAARFGQLAVLKILIAHGAKLNEKTKHTRATPLLMAAESGHEAIIRTLLDAGAKKDEKDAFGKTAPQRYRDYVTNYYRTQSASN